MGTDLADWLGPVTLADAVNRDHPLNRGRLAWWLALPGLEGTGTWYDLCGPAPFLLTSLPTLAWRPTTRPGGWGALSLNGTTSYGSVTDTRFQLAGNVTFACWFNATTLPSTSGIASLATQGAVGETLATNILWRLGLFNNAGVTVLWSTHETGLGVDTVVTSSLSVAAGAWRHAAVVRDATAKTYTFYLDGVSQALGYANNPDGGTSTTTYLGQGGSGSQFLNGLMDNASFWNRALSAAEVKADYDLSRAGYPGVLNRPSPKVLEATSATGNRRRRILLCAGGG